MQRSTRLVSLLHGAVLAAVLPFWGACEGTSDAPPAAAGVVTDRSRLPGGARALGELGDVLMENDQIRIVIQQPGYSRGFGVYGGSLIDAELRRPNEYLNSSVGRGLDQFGELFPAFFLQAVNVDSVVVENDGTNGEPARVVASGGAGDFLELVGLLNRVGIGSHVDFQNNASEQRVAYATTYELAPGDRHVTIRFRVTNTSETVMPFPGSDAETLLGVLGLNLDGFTIPLGDVALYGATSKLFIPGAGFDVRFGLEDSYSNPIDFPAFPGLVGDWVASRGDGVSYGLIASVSENNFVWNKREVYEAAGYEVSQSSMLFPFVAGGFIGVFYEQAPTELQPGQSFEITKYFIVGDGDVGSVLDGIHEIRGVPTGRVAGIVYDQVSAAPAAGTSVFVYERLADGTRRIFSQYDVETNGAFDGTLEPGEYSLRVQGEGRQLAPFRDFTISADETTSLVVTAPSPARIVVNIIDADGIRIPGKASAVGTYDPANAGLLTRRFLFDLQVGEAFRSSDLVPDDPNDPSTLRYVENIGFAQNGVAEMFVRPGTYEVWTSRGPEYDAVRETVTVQPGETATLTHRLRRVVDTPGWIGADLHLHSVNSIDAAMPLDARVLSLAAEGVEWAVSTDHNFVTDYAPNIEAMGLRDFLNSSIGLELTTLESGHFNGYPLDYEVGPVAHGSFQWSNRPPNELFADLRALGANGPDETIVQVNHPRDSILGYFEQYDRNALTTENVVDPFDFVGRLLDPQGPAFVQFAPDDVNRENPLTTYSLEFDALEILNGKLFPQIHHYRIPDSVPGVEIPVDTPPAGTILLDEDDEVAFPGAVDDWYNLLNLGNRYIGVGTSDSHSSDDEAGYFRSMVYVGGDSPREVNERDFIDGMQSRRVVATNGPMIDFYLNEPTAGRIGGEIVDGDGTVDMMLRVTAAPWVGVGRINVVRNGQIVYTIQVADGRDLSADPIVETIQLPLQLNEEGTPVDSWFLVQAIGFDSFFPIVRPLELPPLVLTDAVASLAAPLGFGDDEFGDLVPAETFPITAYAITNPVWVRTAADREFIAPGIVPYEVLNTADNDSGFEQNPTTKDVPTGYIEAGRTRPVGRITPLAEDPYMLFERDPMNPYDIRRIFEAYGHWSH